MRRPDRHSNEEDARPPMATRAPHSAASSVQFSLVQFSSVQLMAAQRQIANELIGRVHFNCLQAQRKSPICREQPLALLLS